MSKRQDEYFKRKHEWSKVKDELLKCYLPQYFNKIFLTRSPLLYIDAFAGPGRFEEDNSEGSPIIAVNQLYQSIEYYQNTHQGLPLPDIKMVFIEPKYHEALHANLRNVDFVRCEVYGEKFERCIMDILQKRHDAYMHSNVFLYVDPFGVKELDAGLFMALPRIFDSAELLLNFNSFGFIRAACSAMKVTFRETDEELFDEADDVEELIEFKDNLVARLDTIAGGSYWQALILRYGRGEIDCYDLEESFSISYKTMLQKAYKYVLDMPIRNKAGNHPKYRMIHATNHAHGCQLMGDDMANRTELLTVDIQKGGQLSLFTETMNNEIITEDELDRKMIQVLPPIGRRIPLRTLYADFYNQHGVLCSCSVLGSDPHGSVLKRLYERNIIDIIREPAKTKAGTPTTFWTENSKQKVFIVRK